MPLNRRQDDSSVRRGSKRRAERGEVWRERHASASRQIAQKHRDELILDRNPILPVLVGLPTRSRTRQAVRIGSEFRRIRSATDLGWDLQVR